MLLLKWFHRSSDNDLELIKLKVCTDGTSGVCSKSSVVDHPAQDWYILHLPLVTNVFRESWSVYHNSHRTKDDKGQYLSIPDYSSFKSLMDISIFDSEPVKQLKMYCATSVTQSSRYDRGCKKLINIKSLDGIKYQANFYNNDAEMRRIVVQPSEDGKSYIASFQDVSVFEKE